MRTSRHLDDGRALRLGVALLAVAAIAGASPPASVAAPSAGKVERAVTRLAATLPVRSTLFGVWVRGRPLVRGALGEARPGVPATTKHHFRIANATESFMVTLLLRFVDEGIVSLDDPLSNWFPELPDAQEVTLGMLARSISGYPDYITNPSFEEQYEADPFRSWKVPELIDLAFEQPSLFEPGTSWAFSDTNFVLLGRALQHVGGKSARRLLRREVLGPLGLDQTRMRRGPHIPAPVIHSYTSERGRYEESTRWSPSFAPWVANMTSTLGDLGRWARELGTGSLLSPDSHALRLGPQNVGLGPLRADRYYGMGSVVANGWIFNNPQVLGYNGVVSYLPAKETAVVAFTTMGRKADPIVAYASTIANRIAKLVDPQHPPDFPVCPRPPC